MKVSATFRSNYPKLSKWIETNIPKVTKKPKVWKAFVKYSELGGKAAIAVTKGNPPEVHFSVMKGAFGIFKGATKPNIIYISKKLCDRFEKTDSKNPKMHQLMEATILHEMVHWEIGKTGKTSR